MAGRIPGMFGPLPWAGLVVLAGRSLETPGLNNEIFNISQPYVGISSVACIIA
jgi:hypothetical protein